MAKNVLIIGAGGVAQVVAHKVAQNAGEFGSLHIASRTVSKVEKIIASVRDKGHAVTFTAHPLDAMDSAAVAALNAGTPGMISVSNSWASRLCMCM